MLDIDCGLSKIDSVRWAYMETGRIMCYGSGAVPQKWVLNKYSGINRLYYIRDGIGTYTVGGRTREFRKGMLYFIPYTARFSLYSNPECPLIHTFSDFELIPPVLCEDILEYSPHGNSLDEAALGVFCAGAVEGDSDGRQNIDDMKKNGELFGLCMKSITYLVSRIIEENGVKSVSDEIVISVLEEMLEGLDRQFCLAETAAKHFIAEDSLIRRFKRVLGVTPYAYYKMLRSRTARYLIDDGMTLEEAAAKVGYADASSLSHAIGKTGVYRR